MSNLFKTPKIRQQEPEPVAPVPDDELDRANQQRKYQRRRKTGRSSTVLSSAPGNNLG